MTACERQHRLAAGAALDDLSPAELARYTRHQALCPTCRRAAAALHAVVAELALAAPSRVPPTSVLDGIRSAIRR